jgi:hypothetical protein
MNLRLKYPPIPQNAARFAADIVEMAEEASGVVLDYSPRSLEDVDAIVQSFADDGCSADDVKETLFGFGCYVGEVFVRNTGATWRPPDESEQDIFGWPMVIELGPESVCNPIGKVFKRLENGDADSLRYFYTVFAENPPPPKPGLLGRLFGRQ